MVQNVQQRHERVAVQMEGGFFPQLLPECAEVVEVVVRGEPLKIVRLDFFREISEYYDGWRSRRWIRTFSNLEDQFELVERLNICSTFIGGGGGGAGGRISPKENRNGRERE